MNKEYVEMLDKYEEKFPETPYPGFYETWNTDQIPVKEKITRIKKAIKENTPIHDLPKHPPGVVWD